jgi:glycosyltransferase involved in cell wall biosynthesis
LKPLIAIEAQRLLRRDKHGLETAAIPWLLALDALDLPFEIHLFVNKGHDEELKNRFKRIRVISSPSMPYAIWEQIWLPRQLLKQPYRLLHATANTRPWFVANIPVLLTLHDLIFFEAEQRPASLYHRLGRIYRKYLAKHTLYKCRQVFTVSTEEESRIRCLFPKLNGKLSVIPNAVNEQLLRQSPKYTAVDGLLMLLSRERRKNSTAGLEAIAIAIRSGLQLGHITLVGELSEKDEQLLETVPLMGIKVNRLAHLSTEELFRKYRKHKVFLFPSLRESFGLPVLEAFFSGCRVVMAAEIPSARLASSSRLIKKSGDPIDLALGLMTAFEDQMDSSENPHIPLTSGQLAEAYLVHYQPYLQ